jgi:putative transcriptional regulator
MIRHHPSDNILAAATNLLPEPHRHVLAVHLSMCATCRARQRHMQEVGGALLDTLPPTPLSHDLLARTLARLDDPVAPPERPTPNPPLTLSGLVSAGRWRWRGPGVAIMALTKRDDTMTRLDLIRVAPGVGLLEHGHSGCETTIVLQGAFDDGLARYDVGDFVEVDPDTSPDIDHCPRTLGAKDCICLIATTGRLNARGWFGRLIRPLIGM